MDTIQDVITKQKVQIKSDAKHNTYLTLLDYISKNCKFLEVDIDSNIRIEYTGDFYGLLTYINSNPSLHYLNMLINGLSSSNEYDGNTSRLYLIDELDQKITYIISKLNNL